MAHLPFMALAAKAAAVAGGKMALAATAASAGSQLLGGLSQAQAQSYNARAALIEADRRNKEAAREAELLVEQQRRVTGRAEAVAGASGFTMGGSAADVLGDLAGQGDYDRRAVLHQGAIDRAALLDEAAAQKRARRATLLRTGLNVGSTLLGGFIKPRAPAAPGAPSPSVKGPI